MNTTNTTTSITNKVERTRIREESRSLFDKKNVERDDKTVSEVEKLMRRVKLLSTSSDSSDELLQSSNIPLIESVISSPNAPSSTKKVYDDSVTVRLTNENTILTEQRDQEKTEKENALANLLQISEALENLSRQAQLLEQANEDLFSQNKENTYKLFNSESNLHHYQLECEKMSTELDIMKQGEVSGTSTAELLPLLAQQQDEIADLTARLETSRHEAAAAVAVSSSNSVSESKLQLYMQRCNAMVKELEVGKKKNEELVATVQQLSKTAAENVSLQASWAERERLLTDRADSLSAQLAARDKGLSQDTSLQTIELLRKELQALQTSYEETVSLGEKKKNRLREKQAECAQLQEEASQLKDYLASSEAQAVSQKQQSDALRDSEADCRRQLQTLASELVVAQAARDDLGSQIHASKSELREKRDESLSLRQENEQLHADSVELRARLAEQQAALGSLGDLCAETQTAARAKDETLQHSGLLLDEAVRKIELLSRQLMQSETETGELKGALVRAAAEAEPQNGLTVLQTQFSKYRSEMSARLAESEENLSDEQENFKLYKEKKAVKARQCDEKMSALQLEFDEFRAESVASQGGAKEDLCAAVSSLQAALAEIESVRSENSGLQFMLESLTASVQQLQEEMAQTAAEAETAAADSDRELELKTVQLDESSRLVEESLVTVSQLMARMQQQEDEAGGRSEEVSQRIAACEDKIKSQQSDFFDMLGDNQKRVRDKTAECEATLSAVQLRLAGAEADLAGVTASLCEKSRACDVLQGQLADALSEVEARQRAVSEAQQEIGVFVEKMQESDVTVAQLHEDIEALKEALAVKDGELALTLCYLQESAASVTSLADDVSVRDKVIFDHDTKTESVRAEHSVVLAKVELLLKEKTDAYELAKGSNKFLVELKDLKEDEARQKNKLLDELRGKIASLTDEMSAKDSHLTDTLQTLSETEVVLTSLKSKFVDKKQECSTMQRVFKEKDDELAANILKLSTSNKEFRELKQQHEEGKAKLLKSEKLLHNRQFELEYQVEENKALVEGAEGGAALLQQATAELQTARGEAQASAERVDRLEASLREASSECGVLQQQVVALEAQINGVLSLNSSAAADVEQISAENVRLARDNIILKSQNNEHVSDVNELRETLSIQGAKHFSQLSQLTEELTALNDEKYALEKIFGDINTALKKKDSQLVALQKESSERIDILTRKFSSFQQELAEKDVSLLQCEENNLLYQNEIRVIKNASTSIKIENETSAAKLREVKDVNRNFQLTVESSQLEIKELYVKIDKMKETVETLRSELVEERSKKDTLRDGARLKFKN